jgi:hypothetical protein
MAWSRVKRKRVYTVRDHHHVLEAWAWYRRQNARSPTPVLLTLDAHTDLKPAFGDWGTRNQGNLPTLQLATANRIASALAPGAMIETAIADLDHDEHIDLAQRLGLVDHVYLFLSASGGIPALPADWAQADIQTPTCPQPHGMGTNVHFCDVKTAPTLLESSQLGSWIRQIEATEGSRLKDIRYILDIDLDYFRSIRGLTPKSAAAFRRLIRSAEIVRIAREPGCVKSGRLDGKLTSKKAEVAVLSYC